MNRKITLILPLLVLGFMFNTKAQCPTNIDFESGLGSWIYYRGSVGAGPTYTTLAVTAPWPGIVTLTSLPGTDPYGFFPVVGAGCGTHSVKLGHDTTNSATERARYYIHVPSTPGIWSLIYHYAAVLNDGGHPATQQPRFVVSAVDSATGTAVPCALYNYVVSTTVPGFLLSSVTAPGSGSAVYYKPWTMGNIKFPGLGGRTITLDVTAAGCSPTGHFGYGYFDMTCGFFANQIISCASGTTTLTGPDGYSAYHWYDSTTFTTSYGTSQVVTITAPTVQTTYAVILTPYTGYGCPDTLYVEVVPSTLHVNPTPGHISLCSGSSVTLSAVMAL